MKNVNFFKKYCDCHHKHIQQNITNSSDSFIGYNNDLFGGWGGGNGGLVGNVVDTGFGGNIHDFV